MHGQHAALGAVCEKAGNRRLAQAGTSFNTEDPTFDIFRKPLQVAIDDPFSSGELGNMWRDVSMEAHRIQCQTESFQFFMTTGVDRVFDGINEFFKPGLIPAFVVQLRCPVFHAQPLDVGD